MKNWSILINFICMKQILNTFREANVSHSMTVKLTARRPKEKHLEYSNPKRNWQFNHTHVNLYVNLYSFHIPMNLSLSVPTNSTVRKNNDNRISNTFSYTLCIAYLIERTNHPAATDLCKLYWMIYTDKIIRLISKDHVNTIFGMNHVTAEPSKIQSKVTSVM